MIEFGHSPDFTASQLQDLGFAACVWPVSSVLTMTRALQDLYTALARDGTTAAMKDRMVHFISMSIWGLRWPCRSALRREQDYLDSAG
jgi:2,3-dimethylmalate lyase